MEKRITLKPSFKSAILMLGMLALPVMVSAQESWKWEREAEDFSASSYVRVTDATADGNVVSGGKFVDELSVGKDSELGYSITDVPAPGMYDLSISYVSMQERYLLVKIADRNPIVVDCTETTGNWNGGPGIVKDEDGNEVERPGVVTKTISVYIPEVGDNDLVIKAFDGYSESEGKYLSFAPNIDKITVTPSTAELKETPEEMEPIEIEMESSNALSGSAKLMTEHNDHYSGTAGVTLGSTGRASYKVTVPETGAYALYIDYTTMQTRWIYVKVNAQPKQYLEFSEKTPTWGREESDDSSRPTIYKKAVLLYLEKGENTVMLNSYSGATSEHSDSPNMDKMTIIKVDAAISDPGYEKVAYSFDYTDMAEMSSDVTVAEGKMIALLDNDERTSLELDVKEATFMAKMPYPLMLTGYAIASSGDMTNWKVEGSVDGQGDWTELGSIGVAKEGVYEQHKVEFNQNEPVAYQYFRLVAKGDENLNIAEWQLFGSPCVSAERPLPSDMFKGDDSGLEASEDGWDFDKEHGERFQYIVDGKLSTKFTADQVKSPTEKTPIFFQYRLETAETARSYSLTVPWELQSRDPKDWTLYGYMNGAWIVLDSRKDIKFPTSSSTLVYNIAEPKECAVYKLEITANNGSRDNTQLTAWQLFDKEQPIYIATGVKDIYTDKVSAQVYSVDNKVIISADQRVVYCIYGLSGQKVKEGIVDGTVEVPVSAGFYIVTVDGVATKVLTR